jgi:endogenous inhibitor of DNA gyrase (YacG/DUF329 family)
MPPSLCPICKKPVAEAAENSFFPFCSDRCKLIDLGRWLDGKYFPAPTRSADDSPDDDFPDADGF